MSLRNLPVPQAFSRPQSLQWDAPADALDRWAGGPQAAEADDPNTISIYDVIGEDFWSGGGFTAKRAAAALRSIGPNPVAVNINSPGGDMFEGLAIFNLLREHKAEVTVNVVGLAASAASVIAMAGDKISMGLGSFMMIHNAWGMVVGNRNDFTDAAETFAKFDSAMADIYVSRTGMKQADIAAMMDAETFITANEALEKGFADSVTERAASAALNTEVHAALSARRRLDAMLAKQGMPRSERRKLLREAAGMQDAAGETATHDAGFDTAAALRLLETIRS